MANIEQIRALIDSQSGRGLVIITVRDVSIEAQLTHPGGA